MYYCIGYSLNALLATDAYANCDPRLSAVNGTKTTGLSVADVDSLDAGLSLCYRYSIKLLWTTENTMLVMLMSK
jgi:hypothetical protein